MSRASFSGYFAMHMAAAAAHCYNNGGAMKSKGSVTQSSHLKALR